MAEQPSYYAIIPAHVRYSKDLTPNEKLLFGEITSLANKQGFCFASNNYFANLYGVHKNSASRWIGNLEKLGFIRTEKRETSNGEQRIIFVGYEPLSPLTELSTPLNNNEYPPKQNCLPPLNNNEYHNNTSNNNKNNTTKPAAKKPVKHTLAGVRALAESYPVLNSIDDDLLDDWCTVRNATKAVFSKTALNAIEKRLATLQSEYNCAPAAALAVAVSKSWRGLEIDWIVSELNLIRQYKPATTKNKETRHPAPELTLNEREQIAGDFMEQINELF